MWWYYLYTALTITACLHTVHYGRSRASLDFLQVWLVAVEWTHQFDNIHKQISYAHGSLRTLVLVK